MRIYLDGPINHGDTAYNLRRAMEVGSKLIMAGHAVYFPHLSHFMQMMYPQHEDIWFSSFAQFLSVCDAYVRLPGVSDRADRSMATARMFNIPIFSGVMALEDFMKWQRHKGE